MSKPKRKSDAARIDQAVADVKDALPKGEALGWYGLVLMRTFYEISHDHDPKELTKVMALAEVVLMRDREN